MAQASAARSGRGREQQAPVAAQAQDFVDVMVVGPPGVPGAGAVTAAPLETQPGAAGGIVGELWWPAGAPDRARLRTRGNTAGAVRVAGGVRCAHCRGPL